MTKLDDDRRAAVGDERQRDARQRHDPEDAADDDERLEGEPEGEPGREELREAVLGDQGDPHPAGDDAPSRAAASPAAPISPSSWAIAE